MTKSAMAEMTASVMTMRVMPISVMAEMTMRAMPISVMAGGDRIGDGRAGPEWDREVRSARDEANLIHSLTLFTH
jgi:hypothetical protein